MIEYAYVHADHLRGTGEIQDEEKFSCEKQTQVMTRLRTWTASEDFKFYPADWILQIQLKKVSVIHFSEGVNTYYWRGCIY